MAPMPTPMPVLTMGAAHDPLSRYRDGAVVAGTRQPIPLVTTRIRVWLEGGLAVVRTERCFRNTEPNPIEATITFPVPVPATLFGLTARIGDRLLHATARRREAARAGYEDAMDRGRTAVLHEEVLRGVHMLSVGQVPPGAEILVASDWAMPMALGAGSAAMLRIPTTVGEVYGRSPLADSDDLVTDPAVVHEAELEVACPDGEASLACGTALAGGRARLRLDRPIDFRVAGWASRDLRGQTADGRGVTLRIAPAPVRDSPVDAVVLVDHSGSMAAPAHGNAVSAPSKHAAVVSGLRGASTALRPGDRLRLWEFDDRAGPVRPRRGDGVLDAIAALQPPRGGTETEAAIAAVLAAERARDIVLVTDGQTHALDLQAAARSGRRFTVVLIGEDSLETNVGTLAALTGGQVFIAEQDIAATVRLALEALRAPYQMQTPAEERPARTEALIGGMRIAAALGVPGVPPAAGDLLTRAVGAMAAALALPRLPAEAAAMLAEAEGLCCHLTSLVLVDEAGEAQEGIPAQRKVPLMPSRVQGMIAACAAPSPPAGAMRSLFRRVAEAGVMRRMPASPAPAGDGLSMDIPTFLRRASSPAAAPAGPSAPAPDADLASLLGKVDWSANPEGLRRGDLNNLPSDLILPLAEATLVPEIMDLAQAWQMLPVVVVLALLAQVEAAGNRYAARFAKSVIGAADPARVAAAARRLGL